MRADPLREDARGKPDAGSRRPTEESHMHYAPVLSTYLVNGNVRERETAQARIHRHYVRSAASWRNWWNMSVVEQPKDRTPVARSVGDRGRLPGI
jgi:hypothetical protein